MADECAYPLPAKKMTVQAMTTVCIKMGLPISKGCCTSRKSAQAQGGRACQLHSQLNICSTSNREIDLHQAGCLHEIGGEERTGYMGS